MIKLKAIKRGEIMNSVASEPSLLNDLGKESILNCNKEDLIDITTISIDRSLSKEERVLEFMEKIKNPYLFKVGDIAVKVVFNEGGLSFQELFEDLVKKHLER